MKPLWAPLRFYATKEQLASPGLLLEAVQDYLNMPNPRTGETKVPTHDRTSLMARICRAKDKSEWKGIIEEFVYVVDREEAAAASADSKDKAATRAQVDAESDTTEAPE